MCKIFLSQNCKFHYPLNRAGVGTTGSKQFLFYAEVTEEMRTGKGGGVVEEGEMIDVIEIHKSEIMRFVMDECINKPIGMMFAVLWYFENKSIK
jgi:UDP-sugar diphosphatase